MHKLLLAAALYACAGPGAAQSIQVDEPAEAVAARAAEAEADHRDCVRRTGSRVVANRHARNAAGARDCVGSNGRVYTRDELERSGGVDLGDALRRLDPSIH